jgi:acetoin utilization protein AcuB
MYVGRIMNTNLVTVSPTTSVNEAMKLTAEKEIDHLLVVDSRDKLIGIVSDRDLKKSAASPATTLSVHELNYLLSKLTVDAIMTKRIFAVEPGTTIERAARVMQENRINALPVMDGEKLAGIITTADVQEVLLQAIGIDTDSKRFTVLVQDRVGVMAEVCQLLKDRQINIRSLITLPERRHPGFYQLVLRVPARDGQKAVEALQNAGFKVLTGYVQDLTPYLP